VKNNDKGYTFLVAADELMWKIRSETKIHAQEWVDSIRAAMKKRKSHQDFDHARTANLMDKSSLVTPRILRQLWMLLPPEQRVKHWALAYSLAQGANLGTLFHSCQDMGPNLMIIQDTKGAMFGVYSPEPYSPQHKLYYGRGHCFVYRINDPTGSEEVVAYSWSRANRYFLSSSLHYIGVGGGDSGENVPSSESTGYALHLDSNLCTGRSSPCVTFDNRARGEAISPVLASEERFTVQSLELWVFVSSTHEHDLIQTHRLEQRSRSLVLPGEDHHNHPLEHHSTRVRSNSSKLMSNTGTNELRERSKSIANSECIVDRTLHPRPLSPRSANLRHSNLRRNSWDEQDGNVTRARTNSGQVPLQTSASACNLYAVDQGRATL